MLRVCTALLASLAACTCTQAETVPPGCWAPASSALEGEADDDAAAAKLLLFQTELRLDNGNKVRTEDRADPQDLQASAGMQWSEGIGSGASGGGEARQAAHWAIQKPPRPAVRVGVEVGSEVKVAAAQVGTPSMQGGIWYVVAQGIAELMQSIQVGSHLFGGPSKLQRHRSLIQELQSSHSGSGSYAVPFFGLLLAVLTGAAMYVCCQSPVPEGAARGSNFAAAPATQHLLGDRQQRIAMQEVPGKVRRTRGAVCGPALPEATQPAYPPPRWQPQPATEVEARPLRPEPALSPPSEPADLVEPAEEAPGPPPICPTLILPSTEARFKISMDRLVRITTGDFDILGTSGRKLLQASVREDKGRRSLSLASVGCEEEPRCTVVASVDGPGLEVYGRGGALYGNLVPTTGGGILRAAGPPYDGAAVMIIEPGNPTDLALTASTLGGRRLGSGGRISGDDWRLQVKPGEDAVLIGSSILALLLLRPSSSLPSAPGLLDGSAMAP